MNKPLRIVFFGTPDFAVASADAIHRAGYDIAAVVTALDKIAGRGHRLLQSAVKQWALENNIDVLQPENLKSPEFLEQLRACDANLFVVIAFRMLPEAVWSMPELGTFNVHGSLLPDYRGAAPINWAIINGEERTGVTTFFLQHEIDTGDIIEQLSTPILADDTFETLYNRLMAMGAELSLITLERIAAGTVTTRSQKSLGESTKKAPKIFHDTCFINWERPAAEIRNFVRGLSPYPAARAMLRFPKSDETEYKIFEVAVAKNNSRVGVGEVAIEGGRILVGCADGAIEIGQLQAPGKKRMGAADFINGRRS